ncbi:hypothetical protein [Microcoleus sp. B3-D7]
MNTSNAASSLAESVLLAHSAQTWLDSGVDENLTQLNIYSVGRVANGLQR